MQGRAIIISAALLAACHAEPLHIGQPTSPTYAKQVMKGTYTYWYDPTSPNDYVVWTMPGESLDKVKRDIECSHTPCVIEPGGSMFFIHRYPTKAIPHPKGLDNKK